MTKVSIIIPVYNGEKTISNSLQSIVNSYFKDYEIVICNDGSTDKTISTVKKFFKKNKKVKHLLINLKVNSGISKAKNTCIENSKGKYIASVDADDEIHPKRLEKQVAFLDKNPSIDVVGTSQKFIFKRGTKINNPPKLNKNIKASLFVRTTMLHPTIMIRSEFIKNKNLKYSSNYRYIEDYLYFLEICFKGGNFANIHSVQDNYNFKEKKKWELHNDEYISLSKQSISKIVLKSIDMELSKENIRYLEILSSRKKVSNIKEFLKIIVFIMQSSRNLNGKYGGLIFFYFQRLKDILILLKTNINRFLNNIFKHSL